MPGDNGLIVNSKPCPNLISTALLVAVIQSAHTAVVINEIHYHPGSADELEEFLELANTGDVPVDLSGWAFTDGVVFVLPPGTNLAPQGLLVVARDPARLRARHGLPAESVLGPYEGTLANGGEILELSDASGKRIDEVQYSDDFPWPTASDGQGPSLECVNPRLDNAVPRNWLASTQDDWLPVSVEGNATSNRLYLYLEAAGECLIDDLSLVESGSNVNLFEAGDFESGAAGWSFTGTHAQTQVTTAEAHSGTHALHVIATGPGQGAETSVNRTIDALVQGRTYRLSFWAKPLKGGSSLISRLVGGGLIARTDLRRTAGTPGRVNSVRTEVLPPLITAFETLPRLPTPQQATRLAALVEGDGTLQVTGVHDSGAGPVEIPLQDNGQNGDEFAGDGVYTGSIPGAPRGTIVDFRVRAVDALNRSSITPTHRYPVASFDVASNLPVYHLFIRTADWQELNADIWTETYFPAVFVHNGQIHSDVGLRFRGGRPRLFRKKSLKLSFADDQKFGGRDRLNLNAAAMDDDYITEPLAYWLYERAGLEASEAHFVRVELNGEFWGLFLDVEAVDKQYLRRFGLDPEGALYKAVGIVGSLRKLDGVTYQGQTYTYESQYEKKTREAEPFQDLIDFIHGLYSTPASQMEAHLEANVDVPQYLNYLAISNAMCVWDNMQHNYYLYRDTAGTGKWRVLPWDLDHAWGEWEWNYYFDATYHPLMGTESRPFANVWYTWNKLWSVLLGTPRFRDQYHARLKEILNTRFAEGPVFAKIDELVARIKDTVALDEAKWPDALEPLHTGPKRTMAQEIPLLKANFTQRRKWLAQSLGLQLVNVPVAPNFRRGDADGDGQVTLGDAVSILWRLFRGGNGFDCADAADVDDNGRVEISDPIRILEYLFRSGAAPPAPGPRTCGADTTADAERCDYSACP